MAEAVNIYDQTMRITIDIVDGGFLVTIAAAMDERNAAWTVTQTEQFRGDALNKALGKAKHNMRLEIDVA